MRHRPLEHAPDAWQMRQVIGFALMAAQRHARIIGLFVRLLRRDGKADYLPHLPRVWRMFERAVAHPALEPLRLWFDHHLPPPLRRSGSS